MICHACKAAGAYDITQPRCVRCGANYRNRPKSPPCPNCSKPLPPLDDECRHCGYTGRCLMCGEPTDFSPDPLYCSDACRVQGSIERYEMDRA